MISIDFNIDNYKIIIESMGASTINGTTVGNSKIEIEKFSDFLKLLEAYSVKFVFASVYFFDELNFNLLDLDDIEEKYKIREIESKIKEHNNKLLSLRYLIGKEESVDLFFNCQGVIYIYSWSNDALDEINDDCFFENLDILFADEIEENEEKQRNELIKRRDNYSSTLKEYIKNDESFLICTNQEMRRSYAQRLLEKDELQPPDGVANYSVFNIVNETWSEIRNSKKLR
ncbi:hypothetical protein BSK66_26640 [Paenibacillus odorifer]|uniref:hypothetical protein n=1 Tax=Paenibacillus TaxID=44249 RepID=UPI0003E267C2|nr:MULTISPECIES: hypothetical protein [Paenibacillus]ETT49326.1 hypothetical protein C171_23675 [Paenibacillus sp. FSL H8-237]OME49538.1 hypothetical protein BSK66_26640 [Paenibacillus odorifer]